MKLVSLFALLFSLNICFAQSLEVVQDLEKLELELATVNPKYYQESIAPLIISIDDSILMRNFEDARILNLKLKTISPDLFNSINLLIQKEEENKEIEVSDQGSFAVEKRSPIFGLDFHRQMYESRECAARCAGGAITGAWGGRSGGVSGVIIGGIVGGIGGCLSGCVKDKPKDDKPKKDEPKDEKDPKKKNDDSRSINKDDEGPNPIYNLIKKSNKPDPGLSIKDLVGDRGMPITNPGRPKSF